ncbi:MAG: T9SS type A sorting domain-containing protein [Bacteroidota bacterium]
MKTNVTLFLFLFFSLVSNGQTIEWQNTYGGDNVDILTGILPVGDTGYLLYGRSRSNAFADKSENSYGEHDYWVVRIDTEGEKLWDRTLGGSNQDLLEYADLTADGGFILGGCSSSGISGTKTTANEGQADYWVVKISADGDLLWDKTFGGTGIDELEKVITTSDRGSILAGRSNSGISGSKSEESKGGYDYWVIKLDETGTEEWQKTIGGEDGEGLFQVIETAQGEYLLSGASSSNISGDKTEPSQGGSDYWLVKIDQLGSIIWQKTIGGDNGEGPENLIETEDGLYLVGGYSYSNQSGDKSEDSNGDLDFWVVAINENGDIVWQNTIGGTNFDALYTISQATDGGYYLGGSSFSNTSGDKTEDSNGLQDMWLVKLDNQGVIEWDKTYGGDAGDDLSSSVTVSESQVLIGGPSRSGISGDKTEALEGYWILQLTDFPTSTIDLSSKSDIQVFPNPTNDYVKLRLPTATDKSGQLRIYDISGRQVHLDDSYRNSEPIDLSMLCSGIYVLEIMIAQNLYRGRVIVK